MNDDRYGMKLTRRALLMGAGGIGFVGAFSSARAVTAAEQFVSQAGTDVIRLANSGLPKQAMRKRFAALVNRYANVRGVGLLALGPYQKDLSGARREEFIRLVG